MGVYKPHYLVKTGTEEMNHFILLAFIVIENRCSKGPGSIVCDYNLFNSFPSKHFLCVHFKLSLLVSDGGDTGRG